ncbi:MAG: hypothetical protein HQL88_05880 [Magnetococcales bacterium]|nr:hypothetical protein [Magnetococcales bacterium]
MTSWSQLVSFIASREGGLAVQLEQLLACSLFETDANGQPSRIELQLVNDLCGSAEQMRRKLADFLTAQGMPGVRIAITAAEGGCRQKTLGESATQARQERQTRLTEALRTHPVVEKMITRFQAELLRVELIADRHGLTLRE